MKRPNKEDFKATNPKIISSVLDARIRYNEALEEYIDYLEAQFKLKNNGDLGDVFDQRELLIAFMEFRDEIYWGENEFTENKDIIELWFKRNK